MFLFQHHYDQYQLIILYNTPTASWGIVTDF